MASRAGPGTPQHAPQQQPDDPLVGEREALRRGRWVEFLTPEQEAAEARLRARLGSEGLLRPRHWTASRAALCRFLQARRWDVEAAHASYAGMMAWRARESMDEILYTFTLGPRETYERAMRCAPSFWSGVDAHGRPVYVELGGRFDAAGLAGAGVTLEALLRDRARGLEWSEAHRYPACAVRAGHPVYATTSVFDLAGLSLGHLRSRYFLDAVRGVMAVGNAYFPEQIGHMFVLNAGAAASALYAALGPLVDARTRSKVTVLSGPADARVFATVPAAQLPTWLGGTWDVSLEEATARDEGPWTDPAVLRELWRRGTLVDLPRVVGSYVPVPRLAPEGGGRGRRGKARAGGGARARARAVPAAAAPAGDPGASRGATPGASRGATPGASPYFTPRGSLGEAPPDEERAGSRGACAGAGGFCCFRGAWACSPGWGALTSR